MEKTCVTKSLAKVGASMVWYVGMKMACFVRQSTTTRISVNLSDIGNYSMKSIEIDSHS